MIPPTTRLPPLEQLGEQPVSAAAAGAAPGPAEVLVQRYVAGDWETVSWAGHQFRVHWPVNAIPTAQLAVRLSRGWGVQTGVEGGEPVIESLDLAVPDDLRLRIGVVVQSPTNGFRALFEGFMQGMRRTAHPEGRGAELELVHIADCLRTGYRCYGQLAASQATELLLADDPAAHVRPSWYTGLDCVFNPEGRGNCRGGLLNVEQIDDPEILWKFPVFADPHRAGVQSWSWARIFMYLLLLARLVSEEDRRIGPWTEFGFLESPDLGTAPAQDGRTLYGRILYHNWQLVDPDQDEESHADDPWAQCLLAKPESHSLQGMNWQQALDWCCARCGIGYTWEAVIEPVTLRKTWGPRFFIADRGRTCQVKLPSPAYTTYDKPWDEVQRAANVMQLDIETSFAETINCTQTNGGPDEFEITVQLVPGWPANADWDVDPADPEAVETAVLAVGDPQEDEWNEWAGKYSRGGVNNQKALNAAVGRLWGLNTFGAWDGRQRAFLPWHEDLYKWFDLADARIGPKDEQGEFIVRCCALRPRQWQACVSGHSPDQPFPPRVEISFDGGGTWTELLGLVHFSTRDLRIFLEIPDLRNIRDAAGLGYPEAYIRGAARLRVTAGLKADRGFGFPFYFFGPDTLSHRVRYAAVNRARDFLLVRRDDTVGGSPGGNSQWNQKLYPGCEQYPNRERDNSLAAEAEAGRFLRINDRLRHRGVVILPDLVLPEYLGSPPAWSGYRPGDRLTACLSQWGAPAQFDLILNRSTLTGDGVVIAAVDWNFRLEAERFAAHTSLQLDDPSRYVSFGRTG